VASVFEFHRWPSWPAVAWTRQSGQSAPQDQWQCPVRITQKLLLNVRNILNNRLKMLGCMRPIQDSLILITLQENFD